MRRVTDLGVLALCCFGAVLVIPVDTSFIAAFLAAVIYGAASLLCPHRRWNVAMTLLYLALAAIYPSLLIFAPLVLYCVLEHRFYILAAALTAACVYVWGGRHPQELIVLGIGGIFALLLEYRMREYMVLADKLGRIRDDSEEFRMMSEEKNRSLMEKQDYEIYAATLKERNRIAREIHDNVGHMLSRAILMVGAMKAVNGKGAAAMPLEGLEETLHTAMTSVRESVHDLHDESMNLREALQILVEGYSFCPVKLTYDVGYEMPREVKYSFVAIVKEALHNVMKHSDATEVRVTVREHPGLYQLIIEDNGSQAGELDGGLGLQNMGDRIRALHGTVQFQTEKGFRIYITVPKKGEEV